MALDAIRAIGHEPDLKGLHIMGTRWNDFQFLPDGNPVLQTFKEVVE